MDVTKLSHPQQNQAEVWRRFQRLMKLQLWNKGANLVKALDALGPLCLWYCPYTWNWGISDQLINFLAQTEGIFNTKNNQKFCSLICLTSLRFAQLCGRPNSVKMSISGNYWETFKPRGWVVLCFCAKFSLTNNIIISHRRKSPQHQTNISAIASA